MNTPRTDMLLNKHLRAALYSGNGLYEIELSDLSRTLERELSAKSAECDALRIGMDAAARNADRAREECQRLREALATLETAARRYASGLDSSSAYPLKLCDKARAALQETQP